MRLRPSGTYFGIPKKQLFFAVVVSIFAGFYTFNPLFKDLKEILKKEKERRVVTKDGS